MVRAEIVQDRFGRKMFRCPFCGHVFLKAKQYGKHILKSHLLKGFKNKRLKKKLEGYIEIIKEKMKKGEKLSLFEERILKMLKLRGIKINEEHGRH